MLNRCWKESRLVSKGSALILCLVFLSVLSAMSLAILEAAWSGQRMVSAYVSHQQRLIAAENILISAERFVWQQLASSGVQQTFEDWSRTEASSIQGITSRIVGVFHGDWVQNDFSDRRCGTLFVMQVSDAQDMRGAQEDMRVVQKGGLNPAVQWHVCCPDSIACESAEFSSQNRLWSR